MTATITAAADQVTRTYARLASGDGAPVRIFAIMCQLDLPDADFYGALRDLADRDGVHLRACVAQQTLTQDDRDFALILGGEPRHNLQIEGLGG